MKPCKMKGDAEFSELDDPREPADLGFLGKLTRDQDGAVLADLLSGVTADNMHEEISFSPPVGLEII